MGILLGIVMFITADTIGLGIDSFVTTLVAETSEFITIFGIGFKGSKN